MSFDAYIARDRHFHDFRFDFHIVNETAQSWYDGSPDQRMPERDWCLAQLKPGMTVVDCGAHHGMLSLLFAHAVGPLGTVIAYEALPSNAKVIEQNAALNDMHNIRVRPVGVGEANTSFHADLNASNSVVQAEISMPDAEGASLVHIVRLDDDMDAGRRVDFIKVDVEGHDLQALRGMPRVLSQRPVIDLELHNFIFTDRQQTLAAIVGILNGLDYRWALLGEIGGSPVALGLQLDVGTLSAFENPHLFGTPC